MSSQEPLYPEVDQSIVVDQIAEKLFPDNDQNPNSPSEETLIAIPNTTVHLIDEHRSVELAAGEFSVVRLSQGETIIAVLARIGDQIQWPLAKDEAAVKLDASHYFFSLRVPSDGTLTEPDSEPEPEPEPENVLNYGLTIGGQNGNFDALDGILERYSLFSVGRVPGEWPDEVVGGEGAGVFWTAVAPSVEDYSSGVARAIAAGSGHVAKGVLWCGDLAVERLNWGNEFLKGRLGKGSSADISPQAMRRMKRVKKLTKMCEDVATGILSGVVKVSGFFTGCIVNSSVGKKFFSLLPGEIVLASLDGFNKVCDAVEVAGRNVMSTTSVVTTGLVSQRYGDEAGKVTNVGFGAAGHAIGTAWAVFKIRKALNPKSVIKPTTLAKAAAEANSSDLKAKYNKVQ